MVTLHFLFATALVLPVVMLLAANKALMSRSASTRHGAGMVPAARSRDAQGGTYPRRAS